jgi:hypothetical protein
MKDFIDQLLMAINIYIKILEVVEEIMFKLYKIFIKNKKDNKLIQKKWNKSKRVFTKKLPHKYSMTKLFHGNKLSPYLYFQIK